MGSKIFREKSIERVSTPEQLNNYLKVPNVSIWVVLLVLFIVATSVFVWAFAGDIITKVDTTGTFFVQDNKDFCVKAVVSSADVKDVKLGKECRIYKWPSDEKECLLGYVAGISSESSLIDTTHYPEDFLSKEVFETGEGFIVTIDLELDPGSENKYKWKDDKVPKDQRFLKKDGLCRVEIIKESIKPINFLVS